MKPPEIPFSESKPTWQRYLENTKDLVPKPLLVWTLDKVSIDKDEALDLGAGNVRNTRALLEAGFSHVDAVDQSPYSAKFFEDLKEKGVDFHNETFDSFTYPENKYDLVVAMNSLYFIGSYSELRKTMNNIKSSLKINGVFTGHFLGHNDAWIRKQETDFQEVGSKNITAVTENDIRNEIFDGMKIIGFKEQEYDRETTDGQGKHWHLYSVVARKIEDDSDDEL